jgi:WD40 repeat protein
MPACLLRETELQPTELTSMGDRDTLIISSGIDRTIKLWHLETGGCIRALIAPRPYEGMDITDTLGLTEAQRTTLMILEAIEQW